MKNQCLIKLRECAGESIGETLVALLISSLALLMLAGAITAATRVVDRSRIVIDGYYIEDNKLAECETTDNPGQITMKDEPNGVSQPFDDVYYYKNGTLGGVDVISYIMLTPAPTPTTVPVGP